MSHEFISEYLNKPWINGGQGPDGYDCWGLVRTVLRDHYNIDVALIECNAGDIRQVMQRFDGHDERANWLETKQPADGDLVLIRRGKRPSHIGIWLDIDGGVIMHVPFKGSVWLHQPHQLQGALQVDSYWHHRSLMA